MFKYIGYKNQTGIENMKDDQDLLNKSIEIGSKDFILRLYSWNTPTLTLGRNQKSNNINIEFCNRNNIPIIRRISGGRALVHDKELTYCFVCNSECLDNAVSIQKSYEYISQGLILGLKKLNIDTTLSIREKSSEKKEYCMEVLSSADISYKNKKLIGSAQFRKNNYILQHGSILIDYNKELINKIFNTESQFTNIISLNEINNKISFQKLMEAVVYGFKKVFNN